MRDVLNRPSPGWWPKARAAGAGAAGDDILLPPGGSRRGFLSQAARFSRFPLVGQNQGHALGLDATKTGRLWKKISSGQAIVTGPATPIEALQDLAAAASAASPAMDRGACGAALVPRIRATGL